ncbi:polysaccharide deacetylase family protein [Woodsholea maritima]|uniref:polysaccharide deacetylase family protein n=1 Tax=Woodsholea maritima TaxID=240237 RepID=UPI00036C8FEF|nr:polysaccharide deacetylase family protein [Woodsholea maritima]
MTGFARILALALASACWAMISAGAQAQSCPGEGPRLGSSRMITLDTTGGGAYGTLQYPHSFDLNAHELVLTFDDGPSPDYTRQVLEVLDKHCVKAVFFLVGLYVDRHPDIVVEIARHGHTIATHTQTHRLLHRLSDEEGLLEIERGFAAARRALAGSGYEDALAPMFRFPGLNHTRALRETLAERDIAVISCDLGTDDWRSISPDEFYRRALRNIEARGSGIVIMHDTHFRTASKLDELLSELARRGYTSVGVRVSPQSHAPDTH